MIKIAKKEAKENKVRITVQRSFGTQNLMEIYSDYVAKQIRKTVRSKGGDKTVNEKKQK